MLLIINMILLISILFMLWISEVKTKRILIGGLYGIALLVLFTIDVKNDLTVNYQFTQTQCRILDKSVKTNGYFNVNLYSPYFLVEYIIDEQPTAHTAKFESNEYRSFSEEKVSDIVNSFDLGGTYPCWYDLKDTNNIVLSKNWSTLFDNWQVAIVSAAVFLFMVI